MSDYKNNHYVPRWFLENFKSAQDELFYYSKDSPQEPVIHRNSKKIFSRDNLYVEINASGKRDVSLERDYFDSLEQKFQPIVQKLIVNARAGKTPQFNMSEKETFDRFLSNMWSRSPDFHEAIFPIESLDQLYSETISELETLTGPLPAAKIQELNESDVKSRLLKNAFVGSLGGNFDPTLEVLSKRGIGIVVSNNPKSSFLTGSYPVTKLTLPGRTNLTDPIVEVWLAISRDVAVTIWGNAKQEKVVQVTQSQIRQINEYVYSQSTEIAGSSKELVYSFAKRHQKFIKRKVA